MLKTVIAYSKLSRESHRHPLEKLCLCIFPIIVLGFAKSPFPILLNILVFTILHIKAKNPINIVLKFAIAALLFATISSITFIFTYSPIYIITLILKTFSGGLCIAYLALTTPLDHILYLGSKNKHLKNLCDISKNMERYILLINDEAIIILNAMKSRGGFSNLKSKIDNTGKLFGLLFINTLKRWNDIKDTLDSRGYNGSHYYVDLDFSKNTFSWIFIIIYNLLLLLMVIYY